MSGFRRSLELLPIGGCLSVSRSVGTAVRNVLFLCSANYYRSRFAEHLFNWLSSQRNLPWRADSRGLLVGLWEGLTEMSHFTVEALQERGIPFEPAPRNPLPLKGSDLKQAHLVVAVKEQEHRREMVTQFGSWADQVEYWHIDDLDCAVPADALPQLERQVQLLVERLEFETGS